MLWRLRAVGEQCSQAETTRLCFSVVPISESSESLTDSAIIVMARLFALVANPMTRYVRVGSIRSRIRQSSD